MRSVAVSLLCCVGCVVDLGVPPGTDIGCRSDTDCPDGMACTAAGVCIAAGEDSRRPGITVSPTTGLSTSESGTIATFAVVLDAPPSAEVRVPLGVDQPSEASTNPSELVFTPDNWATPQSVTLISTPDCVDDADRLYVARIGPASSDDPAYTGAEGADVEVTSINDRAATVVTNVVDGALTTNEAGGTATFTVALGCAPAANVTVSFSASDEGESTVAPTSVVFGTEDWDTPQTVTITGVADCVADGDDTSSVLLGPLASADASYTGVDPPDVLVVNVDRPEMGLRLSPPQTTVTGEDGSAVAFSLRLDCAPTAPVLVTAVSSNDGEGAPTSPAGGIVSLGPDDWYIDHNVIVTGQDDDRDDADQPYEIELVSESTDARFAGRVLEPVGLTNQDNDAAGLVITIVDGESNELGETASFTVALACEPAGPVTVIAESENNLEGQVITSPRTFDASNWGVPQTFEAAGVADPSLDGSVVYSIAVSAMSGDSLFDGRTAVVPLTNDDTTSAGVSVSPTEELFTREDGLSATFTISLSAIPTAAVVVPVSSSDTGEGRVLQSGGVCTGTGTPATTPCSVTLDATNWEEGVTVTIVGQADGVADGYVIYQIVLGSMTSADQYFDGLNPPDVAVVNADGEFRRGFVTDASFSGNLGGISGADAKCNADDARPDVNVTYKALLADGTARRACSTADCSTGIGENIDWVFVADYTYVTPTLSTILQTGANAVAPASGFGRLDAAFPGRDVWTGLASAWQSNVDCNDWTTTFATAAVGNSYQMGVAAISALVYPCSTTAHLICVEQ